MQVSEALAEPFQAIHGALRHRLGELVAGAEAFREANHFLDTVDDL